LPNQNVQIYKTEFKSEKWYEQMVSLFNQFSSIFQVQGHIYQSVDYRSESSLYQHKFLKSRKHKDNNWFDRFPFFWNKLSSDYGANWAKAFWFIMWTSILLYLGILISTGNLFQSHKSFEPIFIGYYFDFINPLRPFDFYTRIGLTPNSVTKLIDLLSRVIIGYGIYQLIAAFRRYGRK